MRNLIICTLHHIRKMKSRSVRWEGHVARMGNMENAYKILNGKPKGRNNSGELGVDGKMLQD
jgi:hypothetical protein